MSKIVLFESDKFIREVYTILIEKMGYDVLGFDNSAKAFDAVRREKPAILIASGEGLPIKTLILQVRKYPQVDVSTIPILVILEKAGNKTEYIEIGASKCLFKFPKSGKALDKEVKNILNLPKLG